MISFDFILVVVRCQDQFLYGDACRELLITIVYDIHVYFHPYVDGHEDVDVNLR